METYNPYPPQNESAHRGRLDGARQPLPDVVDAGEGAGEAHRDGHPVQVAVWIRHAVAIAGDRKPVRGYDHEAIERVRADSSGTLADNCAG